MLRTAPRQLLRQSTVPLATRCISARYQSTVPRHLKRRSFRNSLARWAIAIGGIYWYNTSPLFNEQPAYTIQQENDDSDAYLQPYTAIAPSSKFKPPHPSDAPIVPSTPSQISPPSINPKSPDPRDPDGPVTAGLTTTEPATAPSDIDSLEAEASQQGAFNEETGEIHWDCPCLGGMAYGPCGTEFRDAFSCFVFSDKEPKGVDCIEQFEKMQLCFRAHPEVYAAEIEDDEEMNRELENMSDEEKEAMRQEIRGQESRRESESGMKPEVDEPSVWTPVEQRQQQQGGSEQQTRQATSAQAQFAETGEASQTLKPTRKQEFGGPHKPEQVRAEPEKQQTQVELPAAEGLPLSATSSKPLQTPQPASEPEKIVQGRSEDPNEKRNRALTEGRKVKEQQGHPEGMSESDAAVPKAAHDAR